MNNVSYAPAPPAGAPSPLGAAAGRGHQHQHPSAPQTMAPQAAAPPNANIHLQQQQMAMQQAQAHAQQAQQQQQQPIIPAYTPSNGMAFQAQPQQAQAPPFAPQQQQQGAMPAGNNIQQQQPQPPNMAPAPTAATPAAAASAQPQQQRSIHSLPCTRCGYPNCDIQILGCQCLLHVRCTPVPIRACPNPRCFNSNPATAAAHAAANNRGGASGGGSQGSCPLELLPMEFTELDEARRVADLAAKASWRAKEKSRARKKAKLDNNGGSSSTNSLDDKEDLIPSTPPPPPPTTNSSDLRTGRWTSEETAYCDKLIQKFMGGRLPLPEGIKLNEFLSNMLKSKQSRLTKKMKNAKLSSKTFKRTSGYLTDVMEAREFSEHEDAFFHSLQNSLERAEIKFHMQKEWRETFSTYCVSHGQPLNVDRWLASVEEMERRVHRAKDAERMQRRKMMMGCALSRDMQNPDRGVVIEKSLSSAAVAGAGSGASQQQAGQGAYAVPDPMVSSSASMMGNDMSKSSSSTSLDAVGGAGGQSMTSPFLHKIMAYVHRHHVPFEYIDAWVPSFVPDAIGEDPASASQSENGSVAGADGKEGDKQPKCRLCFAGSVVAKQVIVGGDAAPGGQARRAVPLSSDDQFNLSAFGDYSESFSFDVGCGLPGRVYHMGVPTWEQSVHNAPLHHFERVGGSQQWGIRTVVGIPVPSPNVGRVVVVLYSRHDRSKDHDMVIRLTEEFSRLMPSPKWKLVVDVGQQNQSVVAPTQTVAQATVQTMQGMQQQQPQQQAMQQQQNQGMDIQQQQQPQQPNGAVSQPQPPAGDPQALTSEVISIFGEHMPSDPSNPAFAYLQGFMSLRLLLLRSSRSEAEQDVVNTILSSYSSYKTGGRTRPDIALMLARDFMFLNQMQPSQQQQQPNNGQQPQQQQQYVQQSYAPAPAQMPQQPAQQSYPQAPPGMHQQLQQQQQNQMFSPALSSTSAGSAGSTHQMPPPLPHGSSSGSLKMENSSYPQQQQHQQLPQDLQQQQYQQQQAQQYHQHQAQQQAQQQQYQQQQLDNGASLLAMGDLTPMPQEMMVASPTPGAEGDGVKEEALSAES